jgi:hypothetical protein
VTPPSSPLTAVMQAFEAGCGTLDEVARSASLDRDVVDAAVEHLVRLGRLNAGVLAVGCPDGGCGTCATGVGDAPGCGSPGPSATRSGPVLVALSLTRPGGPLN